MACWQSSHLWESNQDHWHHLYQCHKWEVVMGPICLQPMQIHLYRLCVNKLVDVQMLVHVGWAALTWDRKCPYWAVFFLQSEIANSAWDTQIFHDYEETREQQRAQFDTAVQEASFARTAGRQVIMIAVVNHKAARHHLPIFVSSLRAVGNLDRHLIVATLDPEAQALCQKVCNFNSIATVMMFYTKSQRLREWWQVDCHKY